MDVLLDTELVEMAQAGDFEAFAELYLRHKDWVYRYSISRVGNAEVATDLVQDIFTRALESLERVQPGSSFGAWINGITRHVVIDYLRRDQRRKEKIPQLNEAKINSEILSDPVSFEETLYTKQLMEQILAALNAEERTLINMRLIEGRFTNEVATILYGQDNQENRRKVTVGLYRAMQAARQVAEQVKK
jgi:RNA polymerase sigma-70 factor (ECF subfamily)